MCGAAGNSSAEKLNLGCFCKTLNREQLDSILKADDLTQAVLQTQPQLFSNTTVFISPTQLAQIQEVVHAIERIVQLTEFQEMALVAADDAAILNAGNSGVFMGYDFHLSDTGPQIIEINTNAGGAFLNAALLSAQTECCREAESLLPLAKVAIDDQFIAMFLNEWRYQNIDLPLVRVAIVDENPQQQFLYPEFRMAKRLFERHGIEAVIVDPQQLIFENNILSVNGDKIDLVYNRLTDFSLRHKNSSALRAAYLNGSVVVTPNPHHHTLYANKRNLALLSNADTLKKLGVSEADINIVTTAVPITRMVSSLNAEQLWAERKHLFFKPTTGFGSRATYRGDKLTKRVWDEIISGEYVAQRVVLPSERGVFVDGQETALKMDIRAYVYEGEIQLLAARLYQGQTTNFRTNGGGFAPVFIAN
ncbi:MAG: hypothetical protein H0W44_02350 [Gammaproteobacteria bacterium]|nr:hypothetical protein [Gammaproteobacteria bacterium]